ncbi:hypothetical protein EON65_00825 [archaeon]|nr:MAG: hypothetical protein EON65_00825 [archaeon]
MSNVFLMDSLFRAFQMHAADLQRMRQLMELWMESFDAFCTSSQLLSEGWKSFYVHSPYPMHANNSSPFADVAEEMDRVFSSFHHVIQPAVKETFSERCMQPLLGILALVPQINEKLQQRKTLLLDYDAYKAKMQKKVGRDSVVLESSRKTEKFDESTLKLRAVQEEICSNFAEFEAARPVTLGPELAAFVGCLHSVSSTLSSSTAMILPSIPQASSSIHKISALSAEHSVNYMKKMPGVTSRLLKAPDGFHSPRAGQVRTEPVTSRSEFAGGGFGGYLQTKATGANESSPTIPSPHRSAAVRLSATNNDRTHNSVGKYAVSKPRPGDSPGRPPAQEKETVSLPSPPQIPPSPIVLAPGNAEINIPVARLVSPETTMATPLSTEDVLAVSASHRPFSEPVRPSSPSPVNPIRSATPPPKPPRNHRASMNMSDNSIGQQDT